MAFQSMMALVYYNGQIMTDELMSSQFMSEVTSYLEVNNCMTLTTLKQIILNLFIPFNGKSYMVDLFYRCPITMNGLWTSYRCLTIQDDDDLQYVVAYAKNYEPLIQFELMAFIREYKTTSNIAWEYLEQQLNDSLNIG